MTKYIIVDTADNADKTQVRIFNTLAEANRYIDLYTQPKERKQLVVKKVIVNDRGEIIDPITMLAYERRAAVEAKPYIPPITESLRETRKAKGWSQEETARRCDMSLNTYTRIETGKSSTTLKTLQHICETLGVRLAIVSQ